MTGLDILLFVALILSGVWGYARGFLHEVLAVGTWVLAAFFTKVGAETLSPVMMQLFDTTETIASIISYILIFVLGVFFASFIVKKIASKLHQTDFKSADQTLGFIFGLVRGALLMSGVYLFILWLIPTDSERPVWFTDSRSRPVLRQGAVIIDALFVPGKIPVLTEDILAHSSESVTEETYKNLLKPAVEIDPKSSPDLDVGYSQDERLELDRQLRQIIDMEKLN